MNQGYIRVKGKAAPELVYHPDRLKYPLKRVGERGEGKWERTSWDEALNAIAAKLAEIKEQYGTESISAIHGTGPRRSLTISLLPYALNSPNRISVDPRVVSASYGWWFPEKPGPEHGCFESNINVIPSGHGPRGETCASVATRGTLCKVH